MVRKFSFPLAARAAFWTDYVFRKTVALWFEVRQSRARLFLFEMLYSAGKLFPPAGRWAERLTLAEVETCFGSFRLRPGTFDAVCASPAFERPDLDRLLAGIDRLLEAGRPVVFFDVGADFGVYTVAVGNRFGNRSGFRQAAFEPSPESFALLEENVARNNLAGNVTLFPFALSERDGKEISYRFDPLQPGSSGQAKEGALRLVTATLDRLAEGLVQPGDTVILKIDVEGFETEVIAGGGVLFARAVETWLMVEDFVDPRIVAALEGKGAAFLGKATPYNSWWRLPG
jgi:FkbM family methyltransferase